MIAMTSATLPRVTIAIALTPATLPRVTIMITLTSATPPRVTIKNILYQRHYPARVQARFKVFAFVKTYHLSINPLITYSPLQLPSRYG